MYKIHFFFQFNIVIQNPCTQMCIRDSYNTYSLAITCHRCGINVFEYLYDIIDRCAAWPPNTSIEKYRDLDVYKRQTAPKGDLYKMPKGATVLDFAFAIHSKLGSKCIGAKVNGHRVNH